MFEHFEPYKNLTHGIRKTKGNLYGNIFGTTFLLACQVCVSLCVCELRVVAETLAYFMDKTLWFLWLRQQSTQADKRSQTEVGGKKEWTKEGKQNKIKYKFIALNKWQSRVGERESRGERERERALWAGKLLISMSVSK